jgi:hypothetical protein
VNWLVLVVVSLIILAVTAVIVLALARGRIFGGRTMSDSVWVYRDDSPELFWLMVGFHAALIAWLVWMVLG